MGQIPPLKGDEAQGWILGEQLRVPHQKSLAPSEVDGFLDYLFSDVARPTRQLTPWEGAAVARYLIALAQRSPPGAERQGLEELVHIIWGTVLQFAPFQAIRKETAIRLLEELASTYLVGLDLKAALKQVRDSPPPTFGNLFQAPHLISRHRAVGRRNLRLQDDLSERIYAAYHALRRARIHGARWRIAKVLNGHGLTTRARGGTDREWRSYEVYERVKQYEARLKKQVRLGPGTQTSEQCRATVVNTWIAAFRWNGVYERGSLGPHPSIT